MLSKLLAQWDTEMSTCNTNASTRQSTIFYADKTIRGFVITNTSVPKSCLDYAHEYCDFFNSDHSCFHQKDDASAITRLVTFFHPHSVATTTTTTICNKLS